MERTNIDKSNGEGGTRTATFEREIFIAFKDYFPKAFFVRIYDMQYTPQKPFDFVLFEGGIFYGIEAKHQKSHLDFRRIKEHQWEHLQKVEDNGGNAFFIIRIEDPKKAQKKFRGFVISMDQLKIMRDEIGKKSCNANDLEKYAEFEGERIKLPNGKYTWNFPEYFIEFRKMPKSGM